MRRLKHWIIPTLLATSLLLISPDEAQAPGETPTSTRPPGEPGLELEGHDVSPPATPTPAESSMVNI